MMKLYRTLTAEAVTIRVEATSLLGPISATLIAPAPHTGPVVDGLLWWALDRKLDAFLAHHVGTDDPISENVLFKGVQLLHYVQTVPYHESTRQRAQRIGNTILKDLPELATLVSTVPDPDGRAQAEHAELVELAHLIRDRVNHEGDALHGLDGMIVDEPNAQAA